MTGEPFDESFPCQRDLKMIVVAPMGASLLREASRIGVEVRVTPTTFGRMLAKIALGIAVGALWAGWLHFDGEKFHFKKP